MKTTAKGICAASAARFDLALLPSTGANIRQVADFVKTMALESL